MTKHATGIEWTHIPGFKGETWNPVTGCDVVSPGCTNCYAMKLAGTRLKHLPAYAGLTKDTKAGPVWNGMLGVIGGKQFFAPMRWTKPRAVFVNSMGDLFHEGVSDAMLRGIFDIMALCPQHIFMILTKRPDRMREWVNHTMPRKVRSGEGVLHKTVNGAWPNVWLGVSVEDQVRANERIPALLATPAAKRFVSCEPLLGPVNFEHNGNALFDRKAAIRRCMDGPAAMNWDQADDYIAHPQLDWVIAGGESGPDARPMHPDWATSLRDQCAGSGVPFFFKQWGEWAPGEHVDRQTGTVPTATWFADSWTRGTEDLAWTEGHVDDAPDLYRVGKKEAGHQLFQGVHHNWPGVS